MKHRRRILAILFGGLLLTLTACGNKGPLFLPEEEAEKKLESLEQ